MGFLNPWLLFGSFAVAVPILIHLLNRYRVQTTDWGAMMLLRKAFRVRARQIKLRDILLLILRCAIVLLIALALTRPTIRPERASWVVGRQSVGSVIAIDASYSMQHKAGAKSRFDQALETVREIAKTFRHGQPVTLVLMGHRNTVLLRDAGHSEERLDKILSSLTPTAETLNLEFCINELKPLVQELKSGERELFLVTDAQKQDWLSLSDAARRDLENIGSEARVFLLPIGSPSDENLAITRLELVSGTLRRGSVVRYAATIQNFGKQPRRGVKAMLDVNGSPVDERQVEVIKPGQSVTVPLFLPLNDAGVVRISARLDHDELLMDNQRNAVADVRESTSVLCVDGAPSMEAFQGAADYLTQAVESRAGASAAAVKVRTIPWLGLPAERLSSYDVIFLASVPEITEELARRFYDFVQNGGGLVMFVGDNMDAQLMNQRLRHHGRSFLPATLGSVTGQRPEEHATPMYLDPEMSDHPLTRALTSLPPDLLSEVHFSRVMRTRVAPEARVILSVAGKGYPVLIERNVGQGKVMLFTTTPNRRWNNMPINPVYPVLMQQMITYHTRQAYEMPLSVGQPAVLPLSGTLSGGEVTFRDPEGEGTVVGVSQRQGQVVAEMAWVGKPGFYSVTCGPTAPEVSMAANVDTSESDVEGLDALALKDAMGALPLKVLGTRSHLLTAIEESRVGRELWRVLVVAALVALAFEAWLSRWYSRRQTAEA